MLGSMPGIDPDAKRDDVTDPPGVKLKPRPRRLRLAAASIAAVTICCLLAGSAVADTRYASPTGAANAACTESDPCALKTAVNPGWAGGTGNPTDIADGDTVIVLSGEHTPPFTGTKFLINHSITLRGEEGTPRPRIFSDTGTFSAPGGLVQLNAPDTVLEGIELAVTGPQGPALEVAMSAAGSVVRDVYVEGVEHSSSGPLVYFAGASTLERAELVRRDTPSPGLDGPTLRIDGDILLRDSIIRNTASSETAIRTIGPSTAARIRNLTVAADATAIGSLTGPQQLDIRNSMIDGGDTDVFATGAGVGISITHSNYNPSQVITNSGATVTETPPNQDQTTPGLFPILVNPIIGDFHQRAGSPTRDAGSPDAFTGSLDIDGEPRVMGAAIDIGADEYFETDPGNPGDPGGPGAPGNPAGPGGPGVSPSNNFRFGKLRRNKMKGTAVLPVVLPGPGRVTLRGRGIRRVWVSSGDGGAAGSPSVRRVRLKIAPSKTKAGRKLKRTLSKKGKATRRVKVAFVPTDGERKVRKRKVKLRKAVGR